LTIENVCLITNDWEEEWKVLGEKTEHPDDEEEQDNDEEEIIEGQGNGKHNGPGNTPNIGPSTE
jgi:hypothetical protein